MADTKTYTTNYNLVKPGQDDFYNVDDFNSNADKMDDALYQHVIKISAAHAASAISSAATGDVAATNVQAAIAELASEKLALSGGNLTGAINGTVVALTAAASMTLGTSAGNYVLINGSTTISSFGTAQAGTKRTVRFNNVVTITHNNSAIILPGSANITVASGDIIEFVCSNGTVWVATNYQPLAGFAPKGFGLGDLCTVINAVNLDTVYLNGFYYAINCLNKPTGSGNGYILTESFQSGVYQKQTYSCVDGTGIYVRYCYSGTWSAWKQIPTMDLVMPISGGNMTGAINENYVSMDSADAMDIGSAKGNIAVNGTTTINSFLPARAGTIRLLRFSLPLTINAGSTISLPGVSSIAISGGDILEFLCRNGTVWSCTNYQPITGFAPNGFGLGGSAALTGVDANNYKSSGFFYLATGCSNVPDNYIMLIVNGTGNTSATQIAIGVVSGVMYTRSFTGSAWTVWKQITTSDQLTSYGLGAGNSASFSGDFNTMLANGFYMAAAIGQTNAPTSTEYYFLAVQANTNTTYVSQIAYSYNSTTTNPNMYRRYKVGSTWSAWKQIATMDLVAPKGFGLGDGSGSVLAGVDANNYKTSGFFYFNNTCAGLPTAGYYQVVVTGNGNDASQIATDLSGSNLFYTRTIGGGTFWTTWRIVASIVASGSGTGYYWHKWSNGHIEQWCDGVAVVNADGNVQTITFPVIFPNACRNVIVNTTNNNSAVNNDGHFELISKSAPGCVVMAQYTNSTVGNITPNIYAIGY